MRKYIRPLFLLLLFVSFKAVAQPVANFTSNTITGCAPLLVQFTDASTGGPNNWSWNFGNSSSSVLQNPSTTYTTAGTYTVSLTVSNSSGSNTKTITNYITVLGSPIINFTANDTAGCPSHTVQFTNTTNLVTPGAGTWNWSFGDGTSDTNQNTTHTFNAPGYYNITLIATNSGGCTKSLTKTGYIHVYDPPVANFSGSPLSSCASPATVTFTPTPTGTGPFTYSWNYGDGNSGSSNTHTYNSNGNYTVTMIVTDANGCKDTLVKPSFISIGSPNASFNGPASGCVLQTLAFTNTSSGGGSSWDFGDGTIVTGTNASHAWSTAGTYVVKLFLSNGPCVDSAVQTVTINPAPNPNFTFLPALPCPAPQTIVFTNTTPGGNSYSWNFGDGGVSASTNPSHTFAGNLDYVVTLVATNSFGCKDTAQNTVSIKPMALVAGADHYAGCVPLAVNFANVLYTTIPSGIPYPYAISSYIWNFGDGGTANTSTPMHTYTAPGLYTVTLQVTTINGCTALDTFQITVGTKPNPAFTASPTTSCVNQPIYFNNTSTNATAYVWDFGDGGVTGTPNPVYYYQVTGTWTVTLTAYNNGCDSAYTWSTPITILPPTSLMGKNTFDCNAPLQVTFKDSSIGATSLTWYFGDGTSSTALNPVHTYPALGTYSVMLVTHNNIAGCSDTLVKPLQLVNPTPVVVANDNQVCKGDTVQFQATYLNGTATDYTWQVGNVLYLDSAAHLTHYFPDTGQYNVSIWIKDVNGCWDTLNLVKYVLVAKPDAQFVASPVLGCTPMLVTFTDQTTDVGPAFITSRAWTFGNGNNSTVTTASTTNTYNAPGIYDVTLIVTDNVGCKDTLFKDNYIEARKPHAQFTVNDTTACIGQNLTFNNSSTGFSLTHYWEFGDGTTSIAGQPQHAYTQTGNYTVSLVVTDATGCKDTMVRTNYIDITKPAASFSLSDTLAICPPLHTFFTNTSTGAVSYAWSFGDGSSSVLPNPDNVYSGAGLFTPQLIATDVNGCKDTATGSVNVLGYAGGLNYTPLDGCAPLLVSFTATLANVPSIVWDFSDGVTQPATGTTTTHTYVTPGAYVPKLIISDGAGCLNSSDGLDTIKVDGIYAGFAVTPPCEKTAIQFTDTSLSLFSPATDWLWAFTNGTPASSIIANPMQYYPTAGSYDVTLTVTNANGCMDTVTRAVTIYALPVISALGDTVICYGDAATLDAQGGVSYMWAPAATLNNAATQNPQASPTVATKYVVTGTDVHGCANKDSVQVDIQFKTTSIAASGGAICDDSSFQLIASGAQHYVWSPAATLTDAHIANPIASPHATTTYLVIATEGSCTPDSNTVVVTVYPKPHVDAGADVTIVAGASVILVASGTSIEQFKWTPAERLSCDNCSNPTASPLLTTNYKVIALTHFGCRDSDVVVVHVLCDQSQLFIPNTFTPNGDGQNDYFYPRGDGLKDIRSFRVYNRWGEVVYEKTGMALNDKLMGWDGTYKGAQLSPDTYMYVLEGTCDSGEPINWKGDITLIR